MGVSKRKKYSFLLSKNEAFLIENRARRSKLIKCSGLQIETRNIQLLLEPAENGSGSPKCGSGFATGGSGFAKSGCETVKYGRNALEARRTCSAHNLLYPVVWLHHGRFLSIW